VVINSLFQRLFFATICIHTIFKKNNNYIMRQAVLIILILFLVPSQVMATKAYAVADDSFDYPDHIVEIDLETGDFNSFGRIADPLHRH